MRDLVVVEELEERPQRQHPVGIRLADDDRDISGQERALRLEDEVDRTGAVEERPAVAEILGGCGVDLGRHLPRPRLGRGVADEIALLDRAAPAGHPAGEEQGLEQRRLAREIGADERRAARAHG